MTPELKNKLSQMKPIDAAVHLLKETGLKLSTSQIIYQMAQCGHGLFKTDWSIGLHKRRREKGDINHELSRDQQEVYWSINRVKYPTQTASQQTMFK